MNLIKVLICLLIIFTGVKLLMDGISIIKNNSGNMIEGMNNLSSTDLAQRLEKEGEQHAKEMQKEEQESLAKAGLLLPQDTYNSKHGHKPGHKSHKHGHKHSDKHGHKHGHELGPGGTQHLLGPGGTQHKHHHNHGRRVPDDSHSHKYKRFIPDKLDQLPLTKRVYEEIGKDFMKDEAKKRGVKSPGIHDSEAEVLGKMVWRVYAAEIEQKRKSSPKANDQLLEREIQLLNKVSKIMKSDTDHNKGKGRKHKGITNQASSVSSCGPRHYVDSSRTNNLYGYTPPNSNDIHREPGHAFQGTPIPGAPVYHDISNAIEHCETDRACGGVNYDSTTGKFFLMPVHSKIVRRPHYTAFIKKKHRRHVKPDHTHDKHSGRSHGHHHGQPSPYLPETGIGFSGSPCQGKNIHPISPNDIPRPYNSLMNLFH
jgi:hypothetical protein